MTATGLVVSAGDGAVITPPFGCYVCDERGNPGPGTSSISSAAENGRSLGDECCDYRRLVVLAAEKSALDEYLCCSYLVIDIIAGEQPLIANLHPRLDHDPAQQLLRDTIRCVATATVGGSRSRR